MSGSRLVTSFTASTLFLSNCQVKDLLPIAAPRTLIPSVGTRGTLDSSGFQTVFGLDDHTVVFPLTQSDKKRPRLGPSLRMICKTCSNESAGPMAVPSS